MECIDNLHCDAIDTKSNINISEPKYINAIVLHTDKGIFLYPINQSSYLITNASTCFNLINKGYPTFRNLYISSLIENGILIGPNSKAKDTQDWYNDRSNFVDTKIQI
jgi:hypothetical protein